MSQIGQRNPFADLSAAAAVRAMRDGELRAVSYAAALLEECEKNANLNAFITLDGDELMRAARSADRRRNSGAPLGVLHGLPIPVKDSIHTVAFPTTNGTKSMLGHRPAMDADIVRGIIDAGGIVMGKTNMTELSFGWTSNNGTFGPVRNPYQHDLVPGGSSGGSAAAVAARLAPLAIGADTLGSIRIPAAFCGVVGFRPTFGRYPNSGAFGLTDDRLDQLGSLARRVEDIALIDGVFARGGPQLQKRSLAGIRIAAPPFYWDALESTVREVAEDAIHRLEDAGAVIVRAEIPREMQAAFDVAAAIMLFEAMPSTRRYLDTFAVGVAFDELVEQMADGQRQFFTEVAIHPGRPPHEAYEAMLRLQRQLRDSVHAYFGEHQVAMLAFPSVAAPPPPIGEEHDVIVDGETVSFFAAFGRNTALAPAAGLPALALPAGMSSTGLPVGLELTGLPGGDRDVLALGARIEQLLEFRGKGRPVTRSELESVN